METMMQINNFKQMYLAELAELHDVEEQLTGALRKMGDAARHDALKQAFTAHLEETQEQKRRLAELLRGHEYNPGAHKDQSMAKLIEEAEKMASILSEPGLRDAGLIASAQKIEHYEIAAYGTVAAYAGMLELRDEQSNLHQILEQERATDEKLTMLAKQVVNPDATGRP
jgi:ferritin-like metal-binding protein YciE